MPKCLKFGRKKMVYFSKLPLVSCVMPVRDRRRYIPLAINSYLSQTYDNKELIVVDDSESEELWDLFKDIENCVYARLSSPISIGMKRNIAGEICRGEFLASFDSDDFSSSDRITSQMENLSYFRKAVIGYNSFHLWDIESQKAYRYCISGYVCGASLLYSREHWRSHPFPDKNVGEDEVYTIQNQNFRVEVSGYGKLSVLLHSQNTSTKNQVMNHPGHFPRVSISELPPDFFEALKVIAPTAVNE